MLGEGEGGLSLDCFAETHESPSLLPCRSVGTLVVSGLTTSEATTFCPIGATTRSGQHSGTAVFPVPPEAWQFSESYLKKHLERPRGGEEYKAWE